jgi:Flp pilus assembly protein TadG
MTNSRVEHSMAARLLSCFTKPLRDHRGGIAVTFSLALVPLLGCVALAVDVSTWYAARAQIQNVADGAALASARELRMGNATSAQVTAAARRYAASALQYGATNASGADITASVSPERDEVTISMTSEVSPIFSRLISSALVTVAVEARAKLSGTIPICMVGTHPDASRTLLLEDQAELTADGCGIYSNSRHADGIQFKDEATVTAARICSTGGFRVSGGTSIKPGPDEGCPSIGDPLAHRKAPAGCSHSKGSLQSATRINGNSTVNPGTYCDGIHAANGAKVTFRAGTYVLGGIGLVADGNAELTGINVSFAFKGEDAIFDFGPHTSINLTASKDGDLAGILFIEEAQGKNGREFRISSDNAHNLLGTIYLPRGHLVIDSAKPVAGNSAYTVIVARKIELSKRPRLILNTNYSATDVPVPEGLGPNSPIHLSQ